MILVMKSTCTVLIRSKKSQSYWNSFKIYKLKMWCIKIFTLFLIEMQNFWLQHGRMLLMKPIAWMLHDTLSFSVIESFCYKMSKVWFDYLLKQWIFISPDKQTLKHALVIQWHVMVSQFVLEVLLQKPFSHMYDCKMMFDCMQMMTFSEMISFKKKKKKIWNIRKENSHCFQRQTVCSHFSL